MIKKNIKDINECHVVSAFLILPLIVEFIAVVTNGCGRTFTIILNMAVLVISLLFEIRKSNIREFAILFSIYALIFFNYVFFPDSSRYYLETPMLLVYFIYMPIAVFCIRRITSWNYLFFVLKPYCFVATAISVFIVFFRDVSHLREYFSYMEYSYNVIPFVACSWVLFRKESSYGQLLIFFITTVCVVLYGSRAALLCLILFVLIFEIFVNKGYKRKILIASAIFLFIMMANIAEILATILFLDDDLLSNSYIITRLTNGSLFSSDGRDDIYRHSMNYISSMGLEIHGFFGDRVVNNGIWPHNIFLELIMQFGWLVGPILCMVLIYIIFRSLMSRGNFIISLFIVTTFLGRYWFSGSYLLEGKFWIALFSLITVINVSNRNSHVTKYTD